MTAFKGQCDCGAVQITVPAIPKRITDCPCDFCTRTGVRWAYYPKGGVTVDGATDTYARGAKRLAFHRCKICGVLTHWVAVTVDWANTGVNMRNFDQSALVDVPIGPPA